VRAAADVLHGLQACFFKSTPNAAQHHPSLTLFRCCCCSFSCSIKVSDDVVDTGILTPAKTPSPSPAPAPAAEPTPAPAPTAGAAQRSVFGSLLAAAAATMALLVLA
jgi:hypothetical protein